MSNGYGNNLRQEGCAGHREIRVTNDYTRVAQIQGIQSPWRVNSVTWSPVFRGPQYRTCFTVTQLKPKIFSSISDNLCTPEIRPSPNVRWKSIFCYEDGGSKCFRKVSKIILGDKGSLPLWGK
jgi:hypothetical protein